MGSIGSLSLAAALAVAASGCSHGSSAAVAEAGPEPAASAPTAADSASAPASAVASVSAPVPPPAHHRGFVGAFFKAALETDVTDEEKAAIAKIEEPLHNEGASRHELTALHLDIVSSIKAGKMEGGKLQADEAAVGKAFEAREETEGAALAQLHDTLTPPQRKAVADAVRAAHEAHERPAGPDGGASEWATRRAERMKAQLVLDEDQEKQVAALLARETPSPAAVQARAEASKKQVEAVTAAFEKDVFDPKKADLSSMPGRKPTEPFDRQVKYLTQLLPILTPGQRDRLALLAEHPRERMHADSLLDPPEFGGGFGPR